MLRNNFTETGNNIYLGWL